MDFHVSTSEEAQNLIKLFIYKDKWVRNSKNLDLFHKTSRDYKKFDWEGEWIPRKEALLVFAGNHRFESLKQLQVQGIIEGKRVRVSTEDVEEELFRREVCTQLDEYFWLSNEADYHIKKVQKEHARFFTPERKKRKEWKKNARKKEIIVKLSSKIHLKGFQYRYDPKSPTLKARIKKGKKYLMENKWIFNPLHPLFCKKKDIAVYFEENFLKASGKKEPIEEWAKRNCWALKKGEIEKRIEKQFIKIEQQKRDWYERNKPEK